MDRRFRESLPLLRVQSLQTAKIPSMFYVERNISNCTYVDVVALSSGEPGPVHSGREDM